MEREKLVILGTSLFTPEVVDVVEDTGRYEVSAFIENQDRTRAGPELLGHPVVWIGDAAPLAETHQALCSLGTTRRRRFVEDIEAMGFPFATVVHPTARVSRRSFVGAGSFLSAGVIVAANTRLEGQVLVNRGALIGHDTVIREFVTVGPGANIAGAVTIEAGTYVAMGATVLDRVRIGAGAVVAAGALVTKDVPDRVQVRGVPARIVEEYPDEGGR